MFDIFLLYIILQPIIDVKDGTPYIIVGHMYKLRHGRQVVKLYFPKYIDKVVIIEIKQTCHTVWLHWKDISICFYLF